ncbi:MAG TPA: energy transducer TonB, partial [Candidatus Angelobacter sp.]|nr:energy transducer TonB [Candidatus Angelobacter sp.]
MDRALQLGLLLLPLLLLDSQAQDTDSFPRISSSVAEQNLVKKVEPPYPQMARMAHIEGKVVLSIVISPEGKVSSVRAISGHPILIQPTMDAVYKWEYKPFIVDGKPRWVTTVVNVPFSLP